jgi:hypothetical protein
MTYPKRTALFAEIKIPEGFKIDYVPANDKINNDKFELEYFTLATENKINVSLVYYFKIPVYEDTEYSKLKYYFNQIVNKGSEKIVFVKK